ncbi:hypothetical protein [Arthrobacter pityocampae]|uniref:hypothetical protein n=1 Tax=Arthrobacter pityocampae TaxID=547334 RepID=UPI003735A2EA
MADTGGDLSGGEDNQKPAGKKLKWYWKAVAFLFFGYTFLYMAMPALNSFGIESIRCEVSAARPDTSSGGTRGSASTAGVLVETTDCGKIHVSEGVNFDNQDEIAASFRAGSQYEFDLGSFSRVVTKDIRQGIPSARDYRLVE